MRKIFLFPLLIFFSGFVIPEKTILSVADKIWRNECGGTKEGLTHWGVNEGFPSLGIGHFIWYVEGKEERFEETFPVLLDFFRSKGEVVPGFLESKVTCPWISREEFYKNIDSSEMCTLREFLWRTRKLQADFILHRFLPEIQKIVDSAKQKEALKKNLDLLLADPRGVYALLDYHNFKGSGLNSSEQYKNRGWGLLQVLLAMESGSDPVESFIEAAKLVLRERVQNAPKERKEEVWLPGWYKRLDTYRQSNSS